MEHINVKSRTEPFSWICSCGNVIFIKPEDVVEVGDMQSVCDKCYKQIEVRFPSDSPAPSF